VAHASVEVWLTFRVILISSESGGKYVRASWIFACERWYVVEVAMGTAAWIDVDARGLEQITERRKWANFVGEGTSKAAVCGSMPMVCCTVRVPVKVHPSGRPLVRKR